MSPGVDFGSSVRRLPTRWVALRKSGAFRHCEPQRVGLDGASAPTPHALEDQPLAKQPSSSRADEPHGLLAAQARQGRGVIGIHKCQPATTATVPGPPNRLDLGTGWIWGESGRRPCLLSCAALRLRRSHHRRIGAPCRLEGVLRSRGCKVDTGAWPMIGSSRPRRKRIGESDRQGRDRGPVGRGPGLWRPGTADT